MCGKESIGGGGGSQYFVWDPLHAGEIVVS